MADSKVLIVDDDKELARGLGISLTASGYKVVIAQDAVMATSIARREQPDVVVLDLGLPGGDGFTVMERLRSNNSTSLIPVIILSARDISNEQRALSEGALAYLQKPVQSAKLLATIEAALQ